MQDTFLRQILPQIFISTVLLFNINKAFSQPFDDIPKVPLSVHFSPWDYHGGIQNWDISQDQRGFLYVANNLGLLEYDGAQWRKYGIENNTRLRSVFADSDGKIYVGGQNQFGYFQADSAGRFIFKSLYELLPEPQKNLEDVWKIVKYDDQIFFCSFRGIAIYDGNRLKLLANEPNVGIAFQAGNSLYATGLNTGLAIWNEKKFIPMSGSELLSQYEITNIIPYSNSILIFLKNGKIYQQNERELKEWSPNIRKYLTNELVNSVIVLKNKNLVIGTQNDGLFILSPKGRVLLHLTKGKGLTDRTVHTLFEDTFSNLWVGLNNGITMVEVSSPFSLINEQSGLRGTGYSVATHQNKVYLGTNNGLFYKDVTQDSENYTNKPYEFIKNSQGQVYSIASVDDKLLMAHHKGAFIIKGDSAISIYNKTGTWKFSSTSQKGKIIGGTYEGFVLFESKNDHIQLKKEIPAFTESSRVFEFANDSTIFMTHGYKGVYKLIFTSKFDSIQHLDFYGKKDGLPSNKLNNVFKIGKEKLVFGSEKGVFEFLFSQNRFIPSQFFSKNQVLNDHVKVLAPDINGNIFFFSASELGYLSKTSYGHLKKEISIFEKVKKYLSDDFENIHVIDHKNVFLGAKEGFIHYNPNLQRGLTRQFSVHIRSMKCWNDTTRVIYDGAGNWQKQNISLTPSTKSVQFSYAWPFFYGLDQIQYQYKLEGLNSNWSNWSSMNKKEFNNLSAGSYTFFVRAKNIYGSISQPASLSFSISYPWYLSTWAYLLYFLISLIVCGLVTLTISNRYKKEKLHLTKDQERKLAQKDHEIKEASEKSAQEISRLKNDKLKSEIEYKNRELATTTMHLINKNEFMLRIKAILKENMEKNGPKKYLEKIVKGIDKNLLEDKGWEQFTKHFDQVHGDFFYKIKKEYTDLTPQEIKLCAYLKMNMSTKEIANLLNISVRGVEVSRYRLRKKLRISRDVNLVDFMMNYR